MTTYDDWKTAEPDDEPWAECDCCGRRLPVSRVRVHGIETWACEECRGGDPDEQRERRRDDGNSDD